jgi:hypothetical protein
MKPNLTTIKKVRRREKAFASRGTFPKTDYEYAGALTLGGLRGNRRQSELHSFLQISGKYFQQEAGHEFAREMAFFGAIIATATLPLVGAVYALAHLF